MNTSKPVCVGFATLLLAGVVLVLGNEGVALVPGGVAAALPTTHRELAGVSGLQEVGSEIVMEDEKCCGVGDPCIPTEPIIEGGVKCETSSWGGCYEAREGKPCFSWVGSPVKNGKCVAPPAGFHGPARCSMDPRDFPCQKFRTGVCDSTGWFGGGKCVCDLNSAEIWALGQKRCAQGSTPCGG